MRFFLEAGAVCVSGGRPSIGDGSRGELGLGIRGSEMGGCESLQNRYRPRLAAMLSGSTCRCAYPCALQGLHVPSCCRPQGTSLRRLRAINWRVSATRIDESCSVAGGSACCFWGRCGAQGYGDYPPPISNARAIRAAPPMNAHGALRRRVLPRDKPRPARGERLRIASIRP